MSAVLMQVRAGIRRRRLQFAVISVIVLLASATITIGLTLLQTSTAPWDRAFEEQRGAHLAVVYSREAVTAEQLRATPSLIGATASGGPWSHAEAQLQRGTKKWQLNVVGRDDPAGDVEILRLTGGRWPQAAGEVAVTRSFARFNGIALGDRLTSLSALGRPELVVVGEAVDIDQGDAETSSQTVWVTGPQVAALSADWGYRMVYRFAGQPSESKLRDSVAKLRANLPPGAVKDSVNYLLFRSVFNVTNQIVLSFLIAFGLFALAASAATVANLVTGIVLASYREIGILKAIGFTPVQVGAVLVGQMLLPALAGCLVGIPLGALLSIPLADRAALSLGLASMPAVSPLVDLLALACVTLVVLVAATVPALRAGRLSAVQAISMGSAPQRVGRLRPSRWLQRAGLPLGVGLGAGDAFRRPLRGTLTCLAILVGVATLVFATGLHESTSKFVAAAGLTGSVDVVVERVGPYADAGVMSLLGSEPETERVVAVGGAQAAIQGVADPVAVTAYRGDSASLHVPIVSGRWFREPGEALAPRATLEEAKLRVGDPVTVTIGGRPLQLRIVGEAFSINNLGRELLMDWATLSATAPNLQPRAYLVKLNRGSEAAAFARRVQAAEPDYLSAGVAGGRSLSAVQVLDSVIVIVSMVLVLIALAGVFNTMLLNTLERQHDTAILKTLGMTPRQVLVMVASAAGALGIVGGLLGVPAGLVLHRALLTQIGDFIGNHMPPLAFDVFNPLVLAALGLAGLAVALLGSIVPAYQAARSGIAQILHTE